MGYSAIIPGSSPSLEGNQGRNVNVKQLVTSTVKNRKKANGCMPLVLSSLSTFLLIEDPKPRKWYCPQWTQSFHIS